jgi:hypothetical protein
MITDGLGIKYGTLIGVVVISDALLSSYSITTKDYLIAECKVSGSPTSVGVKINGRMFPMLNTSGTTYQATIFGYKIGSGAAMVVEYFAARDVYGDNEIDTNTLTVGNSTAYDIDSIENAIVAVLSNVSGLNVYGYEPLQIPALPAATIWYEGYSQDQTEAVSFTIRHKWTIRIYVALHDDKIAQEQLKTLIVQALGEFKADMDLGGTVLKGMSNTATVGAILDRNNPLLVSEMGLETLEEID